MTRLLTGLALTFGMLTATPDKPVRVTVPFVAGNEIDLSELVARLAEATGLNVPRPPGDVTLPMSGVAGNLSRKLLTKRLSEEVQLSVEGKTLVASISPALLSPERRGEWERRVRDLADAARVELTRRKRYGLHARPSYRPNDPSRPTVCLIHGVNSSSGGFVHMVKPLEKAGFGVVMYDYAFNRSLEDSCARFARDWATFRRAAGETRPWAIIGHSMGCLVARDYVEGPNFAGDVSTLALIAPVNQGSYLARTQTILQLLNGLKAVNGRVSSEALAHLGDGLGEAADDMTPGSPFLRTLNARSRRAGVAYHILAGDVGLLSVPTRKAIEAHVSAAKRQGGVVGRIVAIAAGEDLGDRLDEVTDGTGDGCVSVARTRLDGVSDHVVIHANHAELIRAPLLFADPGPVACMPALLRWLESPAPQAPARKDREGLGKPRGLR